jgi:hypothetical protein
MSGKARAGSEFLRAAQAGGPVHNVAVEGAGVRSTDDVVRAMTSFGDGTAAGVVAQQRADEVDRMIRRRFITLLGGAATWPLVARAQEPEGMRRIGVLLNATADDAEYQARVGAFLQALALLGWSIGRTRA